MIVTHIPRYLQGTPSVFPICGMENRVRTILQKLPDENSVVSRSQG